MVKFFISGLIIFFTGTMAYAQPMAVNLKDSKIIQTAVLAGGCFWCVESDLEKLPGVVSVVSGYSGGSGLNPTYQTYVSMGYVEVVEVTYDSTIISYEKLINEFLKKINPTDDGGQFCDRGPAYRPAIFYKNNQQKETAEQIIKDLDKSKKFDKPIKVELINQSPFYEAEEYHQDYYKKNSYRYKFYRFKCGRDQFLEKVWGNTKH